MTLVKKPIGRVPQSFGNWSASFVNPKTQQAGYGKKFRASLYGCEFESLMENNTYAPATLINGVVTPDTVHWRLVTGMPANYGLDGKLSAETARAMEVEDGHETRISDLEESVGTGGSVDERITAEGEKHYLKSETYTKEEVNGMITTPDQDFVTVEATEQTTAATDVLPATGEANTIYRVANWDGSQYSASVYSEYTWNTTTGSYVKLDTKSIGIDDEPTAGSDNLVKSKGVENLIAKNRQCSDIRGSVLLKGEIALNYWQEGSFNTSALSVGDTLDLNSVETNQLSKRLWQIIDTKIDDDLRITSFSYHVMGSGNYHNWIKLDEDFKILSISLTYEEAEYSNALIEEGVRYIIYQTQSSLSNFYVKIKGVSDKVALMEEVKTLVNSYNEYIFKKESVDISQYTTRLLYINSNNVWQTSNRNCAKVVPVVPGQLYEIDIPGIDSTSISFLKTYDKDIDIAGAAPNFSDKFPSIHTYQPKHYLFEIPEDTYYIVFTVVISGVDVEVSLLKLIPSIEYTDESYRNIINGGSTIIEQNNKADLDNRFRQSRTADYSQSVLTLLHFSDLHASWSNLNRIMQLYDNYSTYIDDILNTGDLVNDKYVDDITPFTTTLNANKILNVIGNHETRSYVDGTTYWDRITEKECYDKFIAPFKDNWGENIHIVADKGYYYKDYPTQKIRLIVYDCMHPNSEQNQWLSTILSDAKEMEYHVIIAKHGPTFPVEGRDNKIPSNFSSVTRNLNNQFYMTENIKSIVQNFIDAGGIFVCYLCGHTHYDFIGKNENYPKQVTITIASASYTKERDYVKTFGAVNMDLFNIVSVDTENKLLSLFRIGCKHDVYNRNIYSMVYDYESNKLVHD